MANRRMIAKAVYLADRFTDLPATTMNLFTFLDLLSDDDGIVDSVKSAMFYSKSSNEDLEKLIKAGYVIDLGNNIYCLRHWLIMNEIKKDRYRPTTYLKEFSRLSISENKTYEITECLQTGNKTETKWKRSQDKVSTDKISTDKISKGKKKIVEDDGIESVKTDDIESENEKHKNAILPFVENEHYKKIKTYFTEKIGALKKIEDIFLLKELIETYEGDFIVNCIDIVEANEGKTVQYLAKVCKSENAKT